VDHEPVTIELLKEVAQIAIQAGEATLEIYSRVDPGVTYKKDDSPLTAADLASHEQIMVGLRKLTPDIPILSEEGAESPYSERRDWARFWLVDPLDGTKEFIKKNGEFTVNIALVDVGVSTLGVVYAPVLSRGYLGAQELGAWQQEGDGEWKPIRAKGTGQSSLAVVASRSHAGEALKAFLAEFPKHHLVSLGSSLKLCLVANGVADLYPRLGPTMEWDTAAAHAVVSAAGGEVLDFSGEPLRYNKENLLNPYFIVLGERAVPWREAFAAAGKV
jgi:3'(2'), 5'-bisphosphate nucleotidase